MRCRPNLPFPALLGALTLAVTAAAEPVHVVDLLLLRYPAGWLETNARADFEAEARVATARANGVLQASGAHVRLRLAGVDFAGWDGSQADFLSRATYDSNLQALRNRHHADLVCGVTWRSDEGEYRSLAGPSVSQAYGALTWEALRAGLLPAALAPNFGCRPARSLTEQEPALPFGFGFTFPWEGQTYGTIESGAPLRVPLFSSPALSYRGVTLGIPAGQIDAADNVSVLNRTAPVVARFRGDAPRGEPPDLSNFAWSAPADGEVLLSGQPILIRSSPGWRPDGVQQVEVFAGDRPYLTRTNAPFEFTWTPGAQTETTLFATVTDTNGITSVTPVNRYQVKAPNDAFASRQTLVGGNVTAEAHERFATVEPDEPDAFNQPWSRIARSLWWTWTAPADGRVRIESKYVRESAGMDGRVRSLTAFTGERLESLLPFAYAESRVPFPSAVLTFVVAEGETIQLRSASESMGFPSELDYPMRVALDLQFAPAPANDDFRHRTRLSGVRDSAVSNPLGWTAAPGEMFRTAWWTWTAPATGVATWEASPTLRGASIVLNAHRLGADSQLWPVSTGGWDSLRFWAIANQTYELEARAVSGLNGGGGEPWTMEDRTLSISLVDNSPNDLPENALRLGDLGGRIEGGFAGATAESDNPFGDFPTLWWRWTAPADGLVLVRMDSRHDLTVYRADNPLTEVTPLESPHAGQLLFAARGGDEFRLRVKPNFQSEEMASGALRFSTAAIAVGPGSVISGGVRPEFQAFAETEDGELSSVEWLLDGQPLATVTQPPWKTVWNEPTVGIHRLNALVRNVAGEFLAVREVPFTVEPLRPANDNFTNAFTLTGEFWEADTGAPNVSVEPDEPVYGNGYPGTLWWRWIAPGSGRARLRLPLADEPGLPQQVVTYAGGVWGNLSRLESVSGGDEVREFEVQEGQEYRFQVFSKPAAWESPYRELARLELELIRVPANDLYANAITVTDLPALLQANTTLATREAGERDADGDNASASVWWKWVAPTSRTAVVTVGAMDHVPRISVFESPRTPVASNRGQFGGTESAVRFSAVAGRTYYLAADESWKRGRVSLTWEQRRIIPNDDPAEAAELTGPAQRIEGDNRGASQTADEPTTLQQQVWYRFVPPHDGVIQFTISSADQFARAAAFIGGPGAWIRKGQTREDDVYRAVTVAVKAAEPVWLSVGTRTLRERGGPFTLDFAYGARPVNDDFANRLVLTGTSAEISASPFGSSHQPAALGGPSVPGVRPDIWYEWTAPASGLARLTRGTDLSADSFTVYAGTDPARLRPVPLEWVNAPAWPARAGDTFQLRFLGEYPRSFTEQLELTPAPANDDFANRELLVGNPVTFTNTPLFGTREPGEPAHGPTNYPATFGFGHTVWYAWVAPGDGVAVLATRAALQPVRAAVYAGDEGGIVDRLSPVPFTGTGANGSFDVLAGRTYWLALDAQTSVSGNTPGYECVFRLGLVSPPENDDFAQRTPLTLAPDGIFGQRLSGLRVDWEGATTEPGEPGHSATNRPPRRSLWFSWTAPADGLAEAGLGMANGHTMLYRGDRVEQLTRVETDRSRRWKVTAGESYALAVDSEEAGPGHLYVSFYPSAGVTIETPVPGTRRPPGTLRVSISSGTSSVEATSRHLEVMVDGVVVRSILNPSDPQSVELTDLAPGLHELSARFYLNTGATATSAPVPIEITTAPPTNDDFARRSRLTGSHLLLGGFDFLNATREPDEPLALPFGSGRTVWWEWTAPTNGWVVADVYGDPMPAVVGIYRGDAPANLSQVSASWSTGLSDQRVQAEHFPVRAGEVLQIQADRSSLLSDRYLTADLTFYLDLIPAPANDDFAHRQPLTGIHPREVPPHTFGTLEPEEPLPPGITARRSLWWSWTAPADGSIRVEPVWAGEPPVITAYRGEVLAQLQPLARTEAGRPFQLPVQAGTTYQLQFVESAPPMGLQARGVDLAFSSLHLEVSHDRTEFFAGESLSVRLSQPIPEAEPAVSWVYFDLNHELRPHARQSGDGSLLLSDLPAGFHFISARVGTADGATHNLPTLPLRVRPTNDDFGRRLALGSAEAVFAGNNRFGTAEVGEPLPAAATGESIWWTWTAPADGTLLVEDAGSHLENMPGSPTPQLEGALLSLWRGHSLSHLALLATNLVTGDTPADWQLRRHLTVPVTAGTEYALAADGVNGSHGEMRLRWEFQPPVPNDDLAGAATWTGPTNAVTSTLWPATVEPGEPAHGGAPPQHSLWWRWTAPATGGATLRAESPATTLRLAAYAGNGFADFEALAAGSNALEVFVVRGETIHFAVAAGAEPDLRFTLEQGFSPGGENDAFGNAQPLAGSADFTGLGLGSTREPHEPDHALPGQGGLRGGSRWWRWTAPGTGQTRIELGTNSPAAVFVYVGEALTDLHTVASGWQEVTFYAQATVTYRIVVISEARRVDGRLEGPPPPPVGRLAASTDPLAGSYRFTVTGEPGQSFAVLASGDLVHWEMAAVETLQGHALELEENPLADDRQQFFRLVPLPEALLGGFLPAGVSPRRLLRVEPSAR